MVIKGKSVAGGSRLAAHLLRHDTNEHVEVKELRGVAAEDLKGGLLEMEAVASACPRCQKPFYHASINTRADERLTDEQRLYAIDRLEAELGLTGQPRAVVVHDKEGREHCHIVWSRIETERMRAISDSHNYRKHELVARELEREFGHARVQGAHAERDGRPRPERTPGHDEMQQAERGLSPAEAKAQLTAAWRETKTGQQFRSAIEERDWILARGDRRDFVAVDHGGIAHSLARRIEGAKTADIRARFADIEREALPSVREARLQQKAREHDRQAGAEFTASGRAEERVAPISPERAETTSRERAEPAPAAKPAEKPAERVQTSRGGREAEQALMVGADLAGEAGEKLVDFVGSIADSFTGGHTPRQYTAGELARDPAARREQYEREAAERTSNEALDRMRVDMETGRKLRPEDVRALTDAHLMQINHHGDDYLRQVIREREREQRLAGQERERER